MEKRRCRPLLVLIRRAQISFSASLEPNEVVVYLQSSLNHLHHVSFAWMKLLAAVVSDSTLSLKFVSL